MVRLTPVPVKEGQCSEQLTVRAFDLITYSQDLSHTLLRLTGGRTLKVKETTQEIDLLVRTAAS